MTVKYLLWRSVFLSLIMIIGCSNTSEISIAQITGTWEVTGEQIELDKFTSKHGQISLLEGLKVMQHFEEGNQITIENDNSIILPTITGKYKLTYRDGKNYIHLIGESSESIHPIYLIDEKLQISTYVLKKI